MPGQHSTEFARALLDWYARHARQLPWRVGPAERAAGQSPDPYRVWLSEIMLQQTTVAAVRGYFQRFTARWPGVVDLAAASDAQVMAQWAGLGYYARARNLVKCARLVAGEFGGKFPDTYGELLQLPGVGPYSAAAIAAIAFDRNETVVDTNVKRVMARVCAIREAPKGALAKLSAHARALTSHDNPGDYAQAIMDLGATVCTVKTPDCVVCPVRKFCKALTLGIVAELPLRPARPAKPTRHGLVYVARRADGAWLLERREARGLLGGMLGWPGSDWGEKPCADPPFPGNWRPHNDTIKHTFTHFHLRLSLQTSVAPADIAPAVGSFVAERDFRRADLPSVMRKVYDAAKPQFHLDQGTGS